VLTHHAPGRTDELDVIVRCVTERAPGVSVAGRGAVIAVR
jgi:hypothetical protein